MSPEEAIAKYKHVGHIESEGWLDRATFDMGNRVMADVVFKKFIAEEGMRIVTAHANFDAGFEAGVLASEAGLGRYDG